jgi:(S)-citramalyl-CoA lyase
MKAKSLLYTSATQPERFGKLASSGAHVGVIDLEDGVPPASKSLARENLATFMSAREPGFPLAVRINPIATREGFEDLLFLASLGRWPELLIMSMVPSASHIDVLRSYLAECSLEAPRILVTIELPDAISNIQNIAREVDGLIFGSADYCASLGVPIGGWEKLLYARCAIVNAAAQFGIPAYDTAWFKLDSEDLLVEEAEKARSLGFAGKTAIHPRQIPVINTIFTPTSQEIADARQLVQAYEEAGRGIVRMATDMVGPPFYKLARKTLEK